MIVATRDNLEGVITLLKEQVRLSHELGSPEGLAISLTNQAVILMQKNRGGEALKLASTAHELATRHRLIALAQNIKGFLDFVKAKIK